MRRFKRLSTVIGSALVGLWVLAVPAWADPTPTDQVITEVTGAFGEMETIVLALVGALFALVIIGVAIRLGVKYARRGGSQA